MEKCWSGRIGSVLRYQETVKWGEPWTAQDRITVLLIPVFRFLGDKVTRSGSGGGRRTKRGAEFQRQVFSDGRKKNGLFLSINATKLSSGFHTAVVCVCLCVLSCMENSSGNPKRRENVSEQ